MSSLIDNMLDCGDYQSSLPLSSFLIICFSSSCTPAPRGNDAPSHSYKVPCGGVRVMYQSLQKHDSLGAVGACSFCAKASLCCSLRHTAVKQPSRCWAVDSLQMSSVDPVVLESVAGYSKLLLPAC